MDSAEPLYRKPNGALTEAGARRGLELRRSGATYSQIANALGISTGTVYNLCVSPSWGWLRTLVARGQ